jgi:hypothetical protein
MLTFRIVQSFSFVQSIIAQYVSASIAFSSAFLVVGTKSDLEPRVNKTSIDEWQEEVQNHGFTV